VLLQEKVKNYLEFIESGQLVDAYPSANGKKVAIDAFCMFRPTDEAIALFEKAKAVAKEYGVTLRYVHAGGGYADDSA